MALPRIDPATLPPAGRQLYRDSANEDYRFALRVEPHHKKIQSSQWYSEPSGQYPQHPQYEPIQSPSRNQTSSSKRPDLYHVDDIPRACPSPTPGRTMHLVPSTPEGSRSPPRNPLDPRYSWSVNGGSKALPHLSQGPNEGPAQVQRGNTLDVRDIPGTKPKPTTRSRNVTLSTFDYHDVAGTTPHAATWQRANDDRPPVDTRPLHMWTMGGDTGRMVQTHRTPTNPNSPSYKIYGQNLGMPALSSPTRHTRVFTPIG